MEISLLAMLVCLLCREVRVGGVACGDSSLGGPEVEFTCKLSNQLFVPNAAKIEMQTKDVPWTESNKVHDWADVYAPMCTAVFIDYLPFSGRQRALFLTARHCVRIKPGIHFKPPADIAVPQSWPYLKTPLTNDQVIQHMMQHKFYANLTVSCIKYSEWGGLMKRAMHAYPVELRDAKTNIVQVSKVLQYNSPMDMDIALVLTEVTPEFVQLYNRKYLRPIRLPEGGNINIPFTNEWYGPNSRNKWQYIVRAGGFGHIDPVECKGDPVFPCFANFAVTETAKFEYSKRKRDYKLKWSKKLQEIDSQQVYMLVKPEECQKHDNMAHSPAVGLRTTCKGDSGGPAFVVDNGTPVLIGIESDGICTHNAMAFRSKLDRATERYVLVSSLHFHNWIRVVRDSLLIDDPYTPTFDLMHYESNHDFDPAE